MKNGLIILLIIAVLGETVYLSSLQDKLSIAEAKTVKLRKLIQKQAPGDCVAEVTEAATQSFNEITHGIKDLVTSSGEPPKLESE